MAGTDLALCFGMFIQRLLVATDFSVRSRAALRYAVGLAGTLSAEIDVLHITPAPSRVALAVDAYLDRPLPAVEEETLAEARMKVGQFCACVSHEGIRVIPLVEAGDPAATIVRMATELPSDLIIIGTHARTGVSELVLGSVAHRVISCAPCPVVTLRGDERSTHFSKAIDGF